MYNEHSRIRVDARGIWCDDRPDLSSGIYWDGIVEIGGVAPTRSSDGQVVIELRHSSGYILEIREDWPGFQDAIDALTQNLPGIAENWLDQIHVRDNRQQAATVWRRDNSS